MQTADLAQMDGRRFPARRRTRNLVGGVSPIQTPHFSMGQVVLDAQGGQVPWHNQEQEEVYFVLSGTGEMCLGDERQTVTTRAGGADPLRRVPPDDQYRRTGR